MAARRRPVVRSGETAPALLTREPAMHAAELWSLVKTYRWAVAAGAFVGAIALCALAGLVVAVAGCGGKSSVPATESINTKPIPAAAPERADKEDRKPVAEMQPEGLLQAYRTALAASEKYGGKAILLTGLVKSSQQTDAGPMIRVGDFVGNAVDCYFISAKEASSVQAEHQINVLGICNGVNGHRTVDLVADRWTPLSRPKTGVPSLHLARPSWPRHVCRLPGPAACSCPPAAVAVQR